MISSRFKKGFIARPFQKFLLSPPHPWEKGKMWGHPHPVKGLQPLGTLLHSTFEKPCFDRGEIFISPDEYDTLNRLDNWQNVTFNSRDDRMFVLCHRLSFKRTMRRTELFLFFVSCNVFRTMQPEHVSLCLRNPMRPEGKTSRDEGGF